MTYLVAKAVSKAAQKAVSKAPQVSKDNFSIDKYIHDNEYLIIAVFILIIIIILLCSYTAKNRHKLSMLKVRNEVNVLSNNLRILYNQKQAELRTLVSQQQESYDQKVTSLNTDYQRMYDDLHNTFDQAKRTLSLENIDIGEYKVQSKLKQLIKNPKFKKYFIFNNVFFKDNSKKFNTIVDEIDHLLVCPYGIFVLETKYWIGRTLIFNMEGLSKEFAYLADLFKKAGNSSVENISKFKTINIKVSDENSSQQKTRNIIKTNYKINDYGDPLSQSIKHAVAMNKVLSSNTGINIFINPCVVFVTSCEVSLDIICKNEINHYDTESLQYFGDINDVSKSVIIPVNGDNDTSIETLDKFFSDISKGSTILKANEINTICNYIRTQEDIYYRKEINYIPEQKPTMQASIK
jgi:hypothetical protein